MSYNLLNWVDDQDITADKLNYMDSGIKSANDGLSTKVDKIELSEYIPNSEKGVSVATLVDGKVPASQLPSNSGGNTDTTMDVKALTEPLDDWHNLKTGIYVVDKINFFTKSTLHKPPCVQSGICMVYNADTYALIEFYPLNYNINPADNKCVLKKTDSVWGNWFREIAPEFLFLNTNFTGTPKAPTASADTNTTQLATCEFVKSQSTSMQVEDIAISDNYWVKEPSGLITQFVEVEATAEEIDVQFPISFSEKCLFVGVEILNPGKDSSVSNIKFETIEKTLDSVKLLKIGTGTPTISVMAVGI